MAVVGAIQRVVMNDHGRATGRNMDIELHRAGAGAQRSLEGHECVLRSARRISTMSDDLDVAQLAYSSELGPEI